MSSPRAFLETTVAESDRHLRHSLRTPSLPTPSSRRRSILPPLPQECFPLARSSSPRHHASASTSASSSSSTRRTAQAGGLPALSNPPSTPTRQRQQSPTLWPDLHSASSGIDINLPNQWGQDTIITDALSDHDDHDTGATLIGLGGDDELFLSAFADNEFSSPSSYPFFTTNLPAGEASRPDQAAFQPQLPDLNPGSVAPPRRASACNQAFAAPSRSTTQLASLSGEESQNTSFSTDDSEDPGSQSSQSFSVKMPPPPRLQHLLNQDNPAPMNKRQNTSQSNMAGVDGSTVEPLAMPMLSDDDLFGENLVTQDSDGFDGEDLTTIDLTETNEVPAELQRPKVDNRIKLSKFQCVICMDDATALTVTHCGHMYCAQCLHSSLHVEATKGKCPMCRAKVDMKPRNNYNTKTKGYWHLEIKLMTATKGKRKADDIS